MRKTEDRDWLPKAVVLERLINRWDGDIAAVLLGQGRVAGTREGAEESPPFAVGQSLLPSSMKGRSRERGTRCRLPSAGGAIGGWQGWRRIESFRASSTMAS